MPLKLSDLRPCDCCHAPLISPQIGPIFYVVDVQEAAIKPDAARETLALTAYFNGHLGLAEVMSPQPNAVSLIGDQDPAGKARLLLCRPCYEAAGLHQAAESATAATEGKHHDRNDSDHREGA